MPKYIYGDIQDAKPGDIVEFCPKSGKSHYAIERKRMTMNRLYIATKIGGNYGHIWVTGNDGKSFDNSYDNWKLIKTKPGPEAKVGDTVIFIADDIGEVEKGKIYTCQKDVSETHKAGYIYWDSKTERNRYASEFLVLCTEKEQKQPIAYYKRSGEPWTDDDFDLINRYYNMFIPTYNRKHIVYSSKYCFYSQINDSYSAWSQQNIEGMKQVAFEDVFPEKSSTYKPKYQIGDTIYTWDRWGFGEETRTISAIDNSKYYFTNGELNSIKAVDNDPTVYKIGPPEKLMDKITSEFERKYKPSLYQETTVSIDSLITQPNQTQQKENNMENTTLKLLLALMEATEEVVADATNSKYVGIMTDEDNQYVGYIYFDDKDEATAIMQQRENEGKTLHIFKYKDSITQEPRTVISVKRSEED